MSACNVGAGRAFGPMRSMKGVLACEPVEREKRMKRVIPVVTLLLCSLFVFARRRWESSGTPLRAREAAR